MTASICLSCQLPNCDDSHQACALMAPKRAAQVTYQRRHRQRDRVGYEVRKILDYRAYRVERAYRAVREAA